VKATPGAVANASTGVSNPLERGRPRLRLVLVRHALLASIVPLCAALFAACSSVPSYEGGPDDDQPYAIVQPEDNVKLWAIDSKPAFNRDVASYVAPGDHVLKFRVDYPMHDESQHPFEYLEVTTTLEEGCRYRFFVRGEYEKGPPYALDQKVTRIRGYAKAQAPATNEK
jgi:hypothetical protein